jgi:Protein of unknown function (DUF3105)
LPRIAVVALGLALAAAGLIGLVLFLGSRDDSQISAAPAGPGELQPDLGAAHDRPAERADEAPTSGPHRPELVTHDRRELTNDQLLHALELGDVVILYEPPRPDPALERLQAEVAGPFDAELAAAGQAVILAPRAGAGPATALAWRRVLRISDPADPLLREFAEVWLGLGLRP